MSTPEQAPVDPEKIRRLFSHPLHFPSEFKTWMLDQLVLNVPDLPVGQAFQGSSLAKQLKHDASEVSATSVAETTIFSVVVPGHSLAKNGRIVVDSYWIASCGDVSNLGHIYLYFGGVRLADCRLQTAFLDFSARNGTVRWTVENANAYGSQRVWGFSWIDITGTLAGAPADGAWGSGAVDTTVDQTLEIRVAWRDAGSQAFTSKLATAQLYNPVAVV